MSERTQIFPGLFGGAADGRRSEFDSQNAILIHNDIPVDIVFAGDSITHICEVGAYFGKYGLVVNRGVAGDVAEIMRLRFEADVVQLRPRMCVLLIGVNSLGKLDNEPDCTLEEMTAFFEENYRPMMEMAKKAGIRMALCSITPMRGNILPQPERRNQAIVMMNRVIRQCADEYGFDYVDYHKAFVDSDGLTMREGLSADGLHPTWVGFNVMADVLTPILDKALGGSKK